MFITNTSFNNNVIHLVMKILFHISLDTYIVLITFMNIINDIGTIFQFLRKFFIFHFIFVFDVKY